MLKRRALAIAIVAAASPSRQLAAAAWRRSSRRPDDPQIDFVIRPSQDARRPIGRRHLELGYASPSPRCSTSRSGRRSPARPEGEPVGPPLAGPTPEPLPVRERSIRREEEEDPFAQRGIALGAFVIRPSIEIGVSATDNAGGTADKRRRSACAVRAGDQRVRLGERALRVRGDAARRGDLLRRRQVRSASPPRRGRSSATT